jgi:hypothetical protein
LRVLNELWGVGEREVLELLRVNREHVDDRSPTASDQSRLLLLLDVVDDGACMSGELTDADRAHRRAPPSMYISMYVQA